MKAIEKSSIESLHAEIVESSIFRIKGPRINLCEKLIALCDAINNRPDKDDDTWSIGEYSEASLGDLIIGCFWALTEWHAGQYSEEYAALSATGSIFSPGMASGPESGSSEEYVYEAVCDYFKAKARKSK